MTALSQEPQSAQGRGGVGQQIGDQHDHAAAGQQLGEAAQDKLLQEIAFMSRAKSRAADMRSRDISAFTSSTKSSWPTIGARRNIGPF